MKFRNQLGPLVERFVEEQSDVRRVRAKRNNVIDAILPIPSDEPTIWSVNNLNGLLDIMKKLDIGHQDEEADEHIRNSKRNFLTTGSYTRKNIC